MVGRARLLEPEGRCDDRALDHLHSHERRSHPDGLRESYGEFFPKGDRVCGGLVGAGFVEQADGTYVAHGFGVVARSETDNYGWKKFDSVNASHNPSLTVTYDHYPDIPIGLLPTPNASLRGSQQTLSAIYNDVDDADDGRVYFVVYNSAGQVVNGSGVPSGGAYTGAGSLTPSGFNHGASSLTLSLPTGSYTWKAYASDGVAASQFTSVNSMAVDATLPPDQTITVPGDEGQQTQLVFMQPLGNSFLRAYLATVASPEFIVEMVTADETLGVESFEMTFGASLDDFQAEYGVAPRTACPGTETVGCDHFAALP